MILISFLSSHETGLGACYFENIFGYEVYIPQIFEACARCCHWYFSLKYVYLGYFGRKENMIESMVKALDSSSIRYTKNLLFI